MILNALAALIVIASATYALSYATADAHAYRWVIAINLGLVAMVICGVLAFGPPVTVLAPGAGKTKTGRF